MANPNPDYPTAIHTPTDTSAFGASNLGETTPKHTDVHGKIEEEIEETQRKLGIGASPAASATDGQVLTKQGDGTTAWESLPATAIDEETVIMYATVL